MAVKLFAWIRPPLLTLEETTELLARDHHLTERLYRRISSLTILGQLGLFRDTILVERADTELWVSVTEQRLRGLHFSFTAHAILDRRDAMDYLAAAVLA